MSVIDTGHRLLEALRKGPGELERPEVTALVEVEEAAPGLMRKAAEWLWDHPDKDLEPVSEGTQSDRVARTAGERWNVAADGIQEPASLSDLIALLEHARDHRQRLRFVGSARSLSNASQPPAEGVLVSTARYGQRLDLPTSTLRDGAPAELYRAEGGRVLADVLIDLAGDGLSLPDMGSGDFQSLAGALSTATHGSGVSHGAFPSMVRSLDVVTYGPSGNVIVQRVEPSGGITDPERFAAWEAQQPIRMELVQDDTAFRAWVVSVGCLGAIYSVTLEGVAAYWLRETRTIEWWSDVKARMAEDLNTVDYYELLLATRAEDHEGQQDFKCLVTRRTRVTDPAEQKVTNGRPESAALAQSKLGHLITEVTTLWALRSPSERIAFVQQTGLTGTRVPADAPYTDRSFEILLLRLDINATSSELAIPLDPQGERVDPARAVEVADWLLQRDQQAQADMHALLGDKNPYEHDPELLEKAWRSAPVHVSPIALRFVGAGTGLLSMWDGGPRCAIEMPMPGADAFDRELVVPDPHPDKMQRLYQAYDAGRRALFAELERELATRCVARPHWGQVNTLDWSDVLALYPHAKAWRALYETCNQHGVFDGPLTDQLGISRGTHREQG